MCCHYKAQSNFLSISAGVRQGSILGPLLLILYINDIIKINTDAKYVIYADDTSLFLTANTTEELTRAANTTLKKLHEWSKANFLAINAMKTKSVVFRTRNTIMRGPVNLFLGGSKIPCVSNVKTLGVTFNEHLFWDPDIDQIKTNLSRSCGVIGKVRYFLPINVKLLIYNSLFYSQLTYALLVWGSTAQSHLNKLQTLQNNLLRNVTNRCRDSPFKDLYLDQQIIPIKSLYSYILVRHYIKEMKTSSRLLEDTAKLTKTQ